MPPPDWLGNLTGTVLGAAVIALATAAWKNRHKPNGPRAVVGVLVLLGLATYALASGHLHMVVPPFLIAQVPAWLAVLIGLGFAGIGAVIVWLRQGRRVPSERLPVEVWNGLSDDARDVLAYAWTKTDGRLSRSHVHQLELSLGPGWHTAANHLQSEGLLRPVFGGQYSLTQRARDVLSKAPVINQEPDPPNPPPATPAHPQLLPVAEPPEAALWRSLNSNERDVLNKLWSRTGQFVFLSDCEPWRNRWGVPEWNAVIHKLKSQGLIGEDSRRLPGATSSRIVSRVIYLAKRGADLMTWASRQKE
jgi:hypothetical protein